MDKKVLFFDIDGTLLSKRQNVMTETCELAMRKAKECGHLLFINTGRTFCTVPKALKEFPFDGYLCGCGLYLRYHGKIIFSTSLEKDYGQEVLKMLTVCNIAAQAEGIEDVYFSKKVSRFEKLEETREKYSEIGVGNSQYQLVDDFIYDKLFIYTDENSDTEKFFNFISDKLVPIDRGNGRYEIVHKSFSKATGCKAVLDYLNIDKEDSYVFGDGTNDIEMFQYCPHAIAMGKHAVELDPWTEFVTTEVENDGIANAFQHYRLV